MSEKRELSASEADLTNIDFFAVSFALSRRAAASAASSLAALAAAPSAYGVVGREGPLVAAAISSSRCCRSRLALEARCLASCLVSDESVRLCQSASSSIFV